MPPPPKYKSDQKAWSRSTWLESTPRHFPRAELARNTARGLKQGRRTTNTRHIKHRHARYNLQSGSAVRFRIREYLEVVTATDVLLLDPDLRDRSPVGGKGCHCFSHRRSVWFLEGSCVEATAGVFREGGGGGSIHRGGIH